MNTYIYLTERGSRMHSSVATTVTALEPHT
uniref:Uncharacterized protein n=1 Tax=Arundo donax TaxID=35708 RepID=A0A0A9C8G2_ARUDO